MKKFVSGLLIGFILALSITTFAAVELKIISNPYPIFIDGQKTDVSGYNINDSTYLKLSDFKKAGLGINYNSTKSQIEISTPQSAKQQTIEGGITVNQEESTQQQTSQTPAYDPTKAFNITFTGDEVETKK